jgi:RNase P subunit RPR2
VKTKLSRIGAKEKIDEFFKRGSFTPEEVRKVKKLAMKFKIRLGEYRKRFCKNCLSKLKGKTRVTRFYKTVECADCSFKNRFKIQKKK